MQGSIFEVPGIQLRTENKRKPSFYVTARVKKEGVQALSLRSKAIHIPLFSRFSDIFRSFVVFFTAKIPVLMRKPPVSLLSLKIFFHS